MDVEDDEGDGEIDGGDDNDNDDDEKSRGGGGGGVASKTSTSLPATANTTKSAKPGKKRGNIYRCESCSKVCVYMRYGIPFYLPLFSIFPA